MPVYRRDAWNRRCHKGTVGQTDRQSLENLLHFLRSFVAEHTEVATHKRSLYKTILYPQLDKYKNKANLFARGRLFCRRVLS